MTCVEALSASRASPARRDGGRTRSPVWAGSGTIGRCLTTCVTPPPRLAVHAGANVKALQRMLGHKNASMTLDVYADLFDRDLMDVARLLDAAVQVETGVEECGQNVGKNVLKPV